MKCYHFNIRLNNVRNNHAGSKAVEDCKAILLNNNFEDIEVSFIKKGYMMPFNLMKLFASLLLYSFKVKTGSFIIVQYPLLGINKYFKHFAKMLKNKHCKLVCIIHDLDSIRSEDNAAKIAREIDALNAYDAVIAHNGSMNAWLIENGYKGKIAIIELFDYLVSDNLSNRSVVKNNDNVVFAGNLGRCLFLADLNSIHATKFNLYGPGLNSDVLTDSSNIAWNGSFTPEQIVNELSGKYGLIWDGTSIETCTGLFGIYLKYNTPHKASLYFVSNLPVIVPAHSAIATYVLNNNLGIVVDNLKHLPEVLSKVSEQQYDEMKANVVKVGERLKNGFYLRSTVDQVIELVH